MADPSCVQRAELLADLGRYDEAAAELADADPDDVAAQTLLARVKLAAGKPREALQAADAAVSSAPADLSALIARGMVLADLGNVDEAAAQAEEILQVGAGNGYAHTSAAAILAEVRNGQVALEAAWEGVRLTPDQPRAHLVLGVVAARLGLDEIAARAYQEALSLDPRLPVAQAALGVARREQLRYAQALSRLTGQRPLRGKPQPAPEPEATDPDRPPPSPPVESGGRKPSRDPRSPGSRPAPAPRRPASGGAGPDDQSVMRGVTVLVGYAVVAPLWVLWADTIGIGAVPTAVLLAIAGVAAVAVGAGRLGALRRRLAQRPRYRWAWPVVTASVVAAPVLLGLFAVLGTVWPLFAAAGLGAAGLVAVQLMRAG